MAASIDDALSEAIKEEEAFRDAYGPPSVFASLELARAADYALMSDLLGLAPKDPIHRMELAIREWGINDAFSRALPATSENRSLNDFPSLKANQRLADDYLFSCGALRLARMIQAWLAEGLIQGEYREHGGPAASPLQVLVLRTADPTLGVEAISRQWLRWASDRGIRASAKHEAALANQHKRLESELARSCSLDGRGLIRHVRTAEMVQSFEPFGAHYLQRIFGQDLLGPDDRIGGLPFSDYTAAVRVLSGLQHLHLAAFRILQRRHPEAELRNLLAWPGRFEDTVQLTAQCLGCSAQHAERLLEPLTLSAENAPVHTASGEPAWPALIRASGQSVIHPMFGLDINPFMFLLSELRRRYRPEWDRIANNRETRWQAEIADLLACSQYDQVRARGLLLRSGGKHLTDIDFAAYDKASGDLILMQLKWQHPVGADERARRSMAANLCRTGNDWITAIMTWLEEFGADELVRRLGFELGAKPRPRLFVLARYGAQFSGAGRQDGRAAWTSWPHFQKAWRHAGRKPARDLMHFINRDAREARLRHSSPKLTFRVGPLGVLLNPVAVPPPG